MSPLPRNSHAKAGIICMPLMIAFGIGSIVSLSIAWSSCVSYDYGTYGCYYEYFNEGAEAAGLACGALFLVAAIAAYPLTYVGAQRYMKEQNSTGIKGLMIAAWVFYGILIVTGISMIAVGAKKSTLVGPGWVTYEVLWAIVGWIMMFVHAEKARKSPARSVLPTTSNEVSPENPDTWVTEKVFYNQDGTQTRETIKHTKNPDGSITVEKTVEEMELVAKEMEMVAD